MIDQLTEENMEKQHTLFPSDSILTQRFRIIRLLGTGGMGNVFLAEDLQLSRYVAIKTIRPDLSANDEVKKRIAHECRMHAAIGVHPNIIALYDRIEENGNVFLIMEYVEGALLSELLSSQTTLPTSLDLDNILDIIKQVLAGLSAIHQKDIIHRDIKPANIIINNLHSGKFIVKLMDFGIARAEVEDLGLTRLTTLDTSGPGTPLYMAPERIDQKLFGNLSAATDLYSVGVILFQMLSDGAPFRGTMTEIFIGHLTRPPDLTLLKADTPLGLKKVLEKALQKKPTERYSDANHFINEIRQVTDPNYSSPNDIINTEKTLLATDSQLKICQNECATFIKTNKKNIFPLKNNRHSRILIIIGIILISLIAGFSIIQKKAVTLSKENESANHENKTDQIVIEQTPQPDEQKPEKKELTDITAQQEKTGQPDEIPKQNAEKQASASAAFNSAIKEKVNSVEMAVGQEQRGTSKNFKSNVSNPSPPKDKGTTNNSKCQTLLKNFKLGDSSTMQQYQKECTK